MGVLIDLSKLKNPDLLGKIGEEIVALKLASLGFELIKVNYRGKPAQIDIVAIKNATLFAFEVKTSTKSGRAEYCWPIKQRQLNRIRVTIENLADKLGILAEQTKIYGVLARLSDGEVHLKFAIREKIC